jgi:MFS family permease
LSSPPSSPIRRGLVASTWEGSFAQAFISWTGGIFLVKFALRLGVDDVMLSVVTAIPFLATVVQLGTAWVYERKGDARREITIWTLLVARVLWLVPAALALGWLGGGHEVVIFLGVVTLSSALTTAGAHGWQSWMSDLVPAPVRGRYFGVRGAVCAFVALVVGWGGGQVLDVLEARRQGLGYATIYTAAAVAGVLAFVAMRVQHHVPARSEGRHVPFVVLWREIWGRPEFRRVFVFFTAWNVALGVAMPFWAKYMDVGLGLQSSAIAVQGALGAVVGIALSRTWGRLIDAMGSRPVLLVNAISIACIPFLWLVASPTAHWPVWVDCVVVGVFWTGFNLTALNVPLSLAPPRGGAVFLGVLAALQGVAMGVSAVAGGFVARALGPGPHVVLGMSLHVYQVMFLLSGLLRLAAVPLAFRMPEPKAKSLLFLVGLFGYAVRQRLNSGWMVLTAPWRRRR